MTPVQIVIQVYGGVVQGVYCSAPEATVTLVDFDVSSHGDRVPGLVAWGTDNRREQAWVAAFPPEPLETLAGTVVARAIHAAAVAKASAPAPRLLLPTTSRGIRRR